MSYERLTLQMKYCLKRPCIGGIKYSGMVKKSLVSQSNSGWLASQIIEDNVNTISIIIREGRHLTVRAQKLTNISKSTIHRILTENLKSNVFLWTHLSAGFPKNIPHKLLWLGAYLHYRFCFGLLQSVLNHSTHSFWFHSDR